MPITLDHQLQERIPRDLLSFPVKLYHNELAILPNRMGPVHWHPYFELATVQTGIVDYLVGQTHVTLEPEDSIFVNQNMLHGIRQISGEDPDQLPILIFSGTAIAPETSTIYQKYVRPILTCESLPFVVFRKHSSLWEEVQPDIQNAYKAMVDQPECYELFVQRSLSHVVETIYRHLDSLPKANATRVQLATQIRLQKMLSFIYENYAKSLALDDIAGAANVSRSEAGRCFQAYLGCSPIETLIRTRLQAAQRLLQETTLSVQEIAAACGFNSANYFSRQFRKQYGHSPGSERTLGK